MASRCGAWIIKGGRWYIFDKAFEGAVKKRVLKKKRRIRIVSVASYVGCIAL